MTLRIIIETLRMNDPLNNPNKPNNPNNPNNPNKPLHNPSTIYKKIKI